MTFFHINLGSQGFQELRLTRPKHLMFILVVFYLHFKTSPRLFQLFRRKLRHSEALRLFSRLQNFTWLSISKKGRVRLNLHFGVNCSFKNSCGLIPEELKKQQKWPETSLRRLSRRVVWYAKWGQYCLCAHPIYMNNRKHKKYSLIC